MNSARLLEHFDRISEAPAAVPRLRRFILDLAVRGKLVEQESRDEPASQILKRIDGERVRLVKAGEIKRLDTFTPVEPSEVPFAIPSGWQAIRLGWLARKLGAGSTPLGGKSVYQSEGVAFIRSQNVYDHGLKLDDVALISRAVHDRMSGTHVQRQDILLNITGASIGRCALVSEALAEANVSQHVAIIRLFDSSIREFIHLSLTSPLFQQVIDEAQVGVSREGLSMQRLRLFPMLLPPLAEQNRILAKVDELMALCDRLAAAQSERESRRDRLVASSLSRVNRAVDDSAFDEGSRFYFEHLQRLTIRHEQVTSLRRTILNLAVHGRLAPASPWPKQPQRLGAIARLQNGYAFESEWFATSGVRLLRNANVSHGALRWDDVASLPADRAAEFDRFQLNEGDVVLSLDRPFIATGTKVARVSREDLPCLLLQRVGRFQPRLERLSTDYLFLWLHSPHFAEQIDPGRSNGVPHISSKQVENAEIFVPSLAEQESTVVKATALMTLCDRLEAQLTVGKTESRRLVETILHEAVLASA